MKHAQGTLSTGFVVNCCSVMAQPFRPNSSRTKKIHRRSLFCGVDCKQRSPQPKDPFLDGKDGKGLNDSYISFLLIYDTKPSYRCMTSSSLEMKTRVGK